MNTLEVGDMVLIKNFDINNTGIITAKSGLSSFEIKLDNGKYTYTGQIENLALLRRGPKVKDTFTEERDGFEELNKFLLEKIRELESLIKSECGKCIMKDSQSNCF